MASIISPLKLFQMWNVRLIFTSIFKALCVKYIFLFENLQEGVLRFCGQTEFAAGEWAGVELDEPVGKNDGSVGGVTYFHCTPNHGMIRIPHASVVLLVGCLWFQNDEQDWEQSHQTFFHFLSTQPLLVLFSHRNPLTPDCTLTWCFLERPGKINFWSSSFMQCLHCCLYSSQDRPECTRIANPRRAQPLINILLLQFSLHINFLMFLGIFAPSSKITKEPSQPQATARPSSLPTPTVQQTPNRSSQAALLPDSRTSGPSSRNHSRSSSPSLSTHDVSEAEIAEKFEVCGNANIETVKWSKRVTLVSKVIRKHTTYTLSLIMKHNAL